MSDSEAFFELYSDPQTMAYWSDAPVTTAQAATAMLQADIDLDAAGGAVFWAITLASTGEVLGKCTLIHYDSQNRRAEIGYMLNRRYWRQGLMTEVLSELIDRMFTELGLHRVEADTDNENAGSIALLESLGFKREGFLPERWFVNGQWRHSTLLGLLRMDWKRAP